MRRAEATLYLQVRANAAGLHLRCDLDGDCVAKVPLQPTPQTVTMQFPDHEGEHCLELTLSGKQSHYTVLDHAGCIIQDIVAEITHMQMDGVDIVPLLPEHARYRHDHNGTTGAICEPFYGRMGCNGTVSLTWQSPTYQWVLARV